VKSKSPEKTSDEEREKQITDSVFDFFYHDGRRIASLLSQFDPSGLLKEVTQGRSAEEGRDSRAGMDGSAGVPGLVKLKHDQSELVRRSHEEEVLRVYDPTWANARSLLDLLDEKRLISRDVSCAGIGQIVLAKGQLSVLDLGVVGKLWDTPSVQYLVRQGGEASDVGASRQVRRQAARGKGKKEEASSPPTEIDLLLDMMRNLPHGLQGNLYGEQRVWFNVSEQGLSVAPSDLATKYGNFIPGEWSVLGILDAHPDDEVSLAPVAPQMGPATDDLVATVAKSIMPIVRTTLGRPADAYGITPLLIFREVIAGPFET
jgi:hypothetical protein